MVENVRPFLTKHAVRKAGRRIAARRIIDATRDPDPLQNVHDTALFVLETFMGREWVTKRVFPECSSFLTPGLTGVAFNPGEAVMRVIELAEALFHFQFTPGFDSIIRRIRNDSLEPEMAALLVAKMLYINGRVFRFVEPKAQAKQDYDLEITYSDSLIACEVKCKLESTKISHETVLRTLKKAANKQLPADVSTLIFVHLPPNWTSSLDWDDLFDSSANELFRDRARVNAVFAVS